MSPPLPSAPYRRPRPASPRAPPRRFGIPIRSSFAATAALLDTTATTVPRARRPSRSRQCEVVMAAAVMATGVAVSPLLMCLRYDDGDGDRGRRFQEYEWENATENEREYDIASQRACWGNQGGGVQDEERAIPAFGPGLDCVSRYIISRDVSSLDTSAVACVGSRRTAAWVPLVAVGCTGSWGHGASLTH